MPKADKPTANPLTLSTGIALLIPNEKVPVPSQLIWIRSAAQDTTESLRIASSIKELKDLLPASVVWVAEPLYASEELFKLIRDTRLMVASLPGYEGQDLHRAIETFHVHARAAKHLGKMVRIHTVANSARPAAENHAEVALKLENTLKELWKKEGATLLGVAKELTNRRVPTASGAAVWHPTQVRRLLVKLGIY